MPFCFNFRFKIGKNKKRKVEHKITETDGCDMFMNNNPCYQLIDIAI